VVVIGLIGLIGLLISPALRSFESHDYGFVLSSARVPDLDETSILTGEPGEVVSFTIELDLGTTTDRAEGLCPGDLRQRNRRRRGRTSRL